MMRRLQRNKELHLLILSSLISLSRQFVAFQLPIRPPCTILKSPAATTTENEHQQRARRPVGVTETVKRTGFKYWCDVCGVGFKKQKNLDEHLAGKRHARVVAERESSWSRYEEAAPTWAAAAAADSSSSSGSAVDVATAWSVLDDLDRFPRRASGMLDPSATIATLSPQQRARFFRYLHDSFGQHYPEFPAIFHHVDARGGGRYLRVKELFESLEAFKLLSSVVLTAEQQGRRVDTIWDLACGHGLVGILLAYRFPRKKVVCVDLQRRPAFEVFADAWRAHGDAYEHAVAGGGGGGGGGGGAAISKDGNPLANLEYREGDLNDVFAPPADETAVAADTTSTGVGTATTPEAAAGAGDDASTAFPAVVGGSDCVVALHACNEANTQVAKGARAAGAVWAVMPCCIRAELHLADCSFEVSDDDRFLLLSGAFAHELGAQMVRSVDRRITARPVLLAGGFDRPTSSSYLTGVGGGGSGGGSGRKEEGGGGGGGGMPGSNENRARRGRMPPPPS